MPRTGGVIHTVSASTATTIAQLVVKYAAVYRVPVSLAASLIKGESSYDPLAFNPNNQDAKPGESAEDAAKHADIGLAQEDVATALGLPANAKLTLAEIEAKLYDPESSVIFVCHVLAENLTWAKAAVMADPTLRTMIPNGDARVLAAQAYNSGQHGAMMIARSSGRSGPWKYGSGVVARADDWSATLDFMPHA